MIDKVSYTLLETLHKQKEQEAKDNALAIKAYGVTLDEFLAQFENLADDIRNKTSLIEMIIYLDRIIRMQRKAAPGLDLSLTMMDNFHHENLKRDLLKQDIKTLEVKVQNLVKENFAEIKRLADYNSWIKNPEEDLQDAA